MKWVMAKAIGWGLVAGEGRGRDHVKEEEGGGRCDGWLVGWCMLL